MDRMVLTSVFQTGSAKTKEVGLGFYPLAVDFMKALDLPGVEQQEVFLCCIEIMKKLGKVANAVDRYLNLEKIEARKLAKTAESSKGGQPISHAVSSVELEGALEDVLSQAKSSLDISVKILKPLYKINLHTFGDGGDRVIRALERNIPQSDKHKVKHLTNIVRECQPWLSIIINQRTASQHYSNIKVTPLTVGFSGEGILKVNYPRVSGGQLVTEFIDVVYHNVFTFVQDFVVWAMAGKFYSGLVPVIINNATGRDRKFGIGISKDAIEP